MSDLVKRLREDDGYTLPLHPAAICGEAADAIERKDAAIALLEQGQDDPLAELGRSRAAIAELVGVLVDAVEMVETWGAYASEYFQKKWDHDGDVAKLRAAITKHENKEVI